MEGRGTRNARAECSGCGSVNNGQQMENQSYGAVVVHGEVKPGNGNHWEHESVHAVVYFSVCCVASQTPVISVGNDWPVMEVRKS